MNTDINTINQLAAYLKTIDAIRLAYIFGSSVNRKEGASPSDVDLAILFGREVVSDDKVDIRLDITVRAEKLFGRRADIVVLNDASPFR